MCSNHNNKPAGIPWFSALTVALIAFTVGATLHAFYS